MKICCRFRVKEKHERSNQAVLVELQLVSKADSGPHPHVQPVQLLHAERNALTLKKTGALALSDLFEPAKGFFEAGLVVASQWPIILNQFVLCILWDNNKTIDLDLFLMWLSEQCVRGKFGIFGRIFGMFRIFGMSMFRIFGKLATFYIFVLYFHTVIVGDCVL
jgi:hypothetical protein